MTTSKQRKGQKRAIAPDAYQAVEKSFVRSAFWSRLMLAAFFTVTAVTLLWAIPWFPYGTSVQDYNSRVGMMALLGISASVFAFGAVRLRDKLRRAESTYVAMSSVHDSLTDLRRREYFYDHLVRACDLAKQSGDAFAVVVLRIDVEEGQTLEVSPVQLVVEALEPFAKEYDWLAPIGAHEVAIFAPQVSNANAPRVAEELRRSAEGSASMPGLHFAAGWAVYGPDLDEAGDLLGQARGTVVREEQSESLSA